MMSAVSKDQKLHYSLHLCDLNRLSFMISNYSECFFSILAVLLWENVAMEVLNKTNWGWAGPSSAQAGIELWLRYTTLNWLREGSQKKLRKFGHMSKLGLPYLPTSLVWTKKVCTSTPIVYPTYLSKKFGHFWIEVCL